MRISRRRVLTSLPAIALAGIAARVGAQAKASPAITLVVPYARGGAADRLGRVTAAALQKSLMQPVSVLNVADGNGVAGTDHIAEASPNGLVIGVAHSTPIVAATLLRRQKAYDVFRDFDWITIIGTYAAALVVRVNAPDSLTAWLDMARTSALPLRYGTGGVGTPGHFAGEFLRLEQGAKLQHVPFATVPEAYAALDAGHIAALFDGVPNASKSGTLNNRKLLAVTSEHRHSSLPELPSFGELWPRQHFVVWTGLVAPPGLPTPVRARLAHAAAQLFDDAAYLASLRELGVDILALHDRQAVLYVEEDFLRQARLIARMRSEPPN